MFVVLQTVLDMCPVDGDSDVSWLCRLSSVYILCSERQLKHSLAGKKTFIYFRKSELRKFFSVTC